MGGRISADGVNMPPMDSDMDLASQIEVKGCYIDNWKQPVVVAQKGATLQVCYGNSLLQGAISGNRVEVESFYSAGTVDQFGNVQFPDAGFWSRQIPCSGKGCHDLTGKYIDNYSKSVEVEQLGHELLVNYAGDQKKGFIGGHSMVCEHGVYKKGTSCSGTLHIASFKSSGEVDAAGDVKFGDGGWWQKKTEVGDAAVAKGNEEAAGIESNEAKVSTVSASNRTMCTLSEPVPAKDADLGASESKDVSHAIHVGEPTGVEVSSFSGEKVGEKNIETSAKTTECKSTFAGVKLRKRAANTSIPQQQQQPVVPFASVMLKSTKLRDKPSPHGEPKAAESSLVSAVDELS